MNKLYSFALIMGLLLVNACTTSNLQNPSAVPASNDNFLANKTRMTSASYLGVQITHTTADGKAYLWFPGNRELVTGTYEIKGTDESAEVCFYYRNSYNAFTGSTAPNCFKNAQQRLIGNAIDIKEGDFLGLSRRNSVPFVLEKPYSSLNQVKANIKSGR